MRMLTLVTAAIFAAATGGTVIAADKPVNPKVAQQEFNAAVKKAKAEYKASIEKCKQGAQADRSACYKTARHARNEAYEAASDAYTNATGKPEPSPGA